MNVTEPVELNARLFPDKAAIIFEDQTISYSALADAANRAANALIGGGIRRGDRVALLLGNSAAFAVAYLAVLKAGAVAVSVDPTLARKDASFVVTDSGAALVITTEELRANVPAGVTTWFADQRHDRDLTLKELSARASSKPVTAEMEPGDLAVLLYTSGTTGFPKGAELTHANVVSNCWSTVHHVGYRPTDRIIDFLPLFEVFGQNFILNAALRAGSTLVLHRRFVPDQVLDSVKRHGVDVFLGVPSAYIGLLNSGLDLSPLTKVRYDFSADATMPIDVGEQWEARFGRPIHEGYILTECSPFACYNHHFKHVAGSVGSAIENHELRIINENAESVPAGDLGEIVIRGPGVMKGYWNRPEESAAALRGGWLHSGDIGRLDDAGYVYIVDRLENMVRVAGFKR